MIAQYIAKDNNYVGSVLVFPGKHNIKNPVGYIWFMK